MYYNDENNPIPTELPPPPANVTVLPVDGSSALVTWRSPGDPEVTPPRPDGYQVYARSQTGHRCRIYADADRTHVRRVLLDIRLWHCIQDDAPTATRSGIRFCSGFV